MLIILIMLIMDFAKSRLSSTFFFREIVVSNTVVSLSTIYGF